VVLVYPREQEVGNYLSPINHHLGSLDA
jgi:hypothetical protein